MIEKKCSSLEEMIRLIKDDVIGIYNKCNKLGIITNKMEGSLEDILDDYLESRYHESDGVNLYEVSGKYIISVIFVGGWANLGMSNKGIYAYGNIRLCIKDYKSGTYLFGHPFDTMTIEDLVMYLKTDKVVKSSLHRFAYNLLGDDGSIKYTIYGKDNSCVYDYFKSFGARNIKSQKIDGSTSRYIMIKDNKPYTFIIKRNVIKS